MIGPKIKNDPKKLTFAWLFYWMGIVGVVTIVLRGLDFDYHNNFMLFTNYFLGMGVLGLVLFGTGEKVFKRLLESNLFLFFLLPSIFFFIATLTVQWVKPLTVEQTNILKEIGLAFPYFTAETYLAKFADIIFQQLMIFSLIIGFKKIGMTDKKVVMSFTFIFFILHLPLIFIFDLYGLFFIIPCVLAGGVFSYLFLKFKEGPYYSMMVHQGFYLILGTLLRYIV